MTEEEIHKSENIQNQEANNPEGSDLHKIMHVQSMFENWFLDYASYSILDRAVPDVLDGLKPVQRRILHSMDELEDGRYNKVANIIGNTMKYHPHGDASIEDALVNFGQKQLTIDTQGNWGNIITGDPAAAARYIEARLSKFALDVLFNHKTTEWQLSYDGRNREPITLPVKFPLLLAQGAMGIAVSLKTEILPHNFIELIDGSIAILENQDFEIYPDFPTGGSIDVSKYNDGLRGGKIRIRAKISIIDKKTLVITEIPFFTNTTDLINKSIVPAINNGKLKIRKVDDNTAANAEIILHLDKDVSPDQTIDALYAFTNCEMSKSVNACVLHNRKPQFLSVKEILRINTERTRDLLRQELEIALKELQQEWHRISLEIIFFEKRIYKELEKDTTSWEEQVENIERAFDAYRPLFRFEITRDDILKLCEKPVRKISKFDIKKAEDQIKSIDDEILKIENDLKNLTQYTINFYKELKRKYGKGRERKTEIKNFDNIVAATVAVNNKKLMVNRKEGFVGINMKKEEGVEFVCDCSDLDEVIVFREEGVFSVSKVSDKQFFGKNIIHVEVFKRNDDRTIFNVVYSDGNNGTAMAKRFAIGGVTRDKEYDITKGKTGSKVLYLSSNPNGEAEKIKVYLKEKKNIKKKQFEFDFSTLAIKGRSAGGNILSRHPVKRIDLLEKGVSTLSAINIYFDDAVMRLNTDERGVLLGSFKENDKIITLYKSGYYKITGFELSVHFEDNLEIIEKFNPKKIITFIYKNRKEGTYFIKRFIPDIFDKPVNFLPEDKDLQLVLYSYNTFPQIEVTAIPKKEKPEETTIISCAEFVDVMSAKAKGKKINLGLIKKVKMLDPLPEPEIEEESTEDEIIETEVEDNNPEDSTPDDPLYIDMEIAKEIFDSIDVKKIKIEIPTEENEKINEKPDDEDGTQLSLF